MKLVSVFPFCSKDKATEINYTQLYRGPQNVYQYLHHRAGVTEITTKPMRNNYSYALHFTPFTFSSDRFDDVERFSVRTLNGATRSLRFSMSYETKCPRAPPTPSTTPAPTRKTVTLLQYLLGWYR